MSACRLVVLDLFGTTVAEDGSIEETLRAVLDAHGVACDTEGLARVRGLAKRDALRTLLGPQRQDEVERIYTSFISALRARWDRQPPQAAAGAVDVLAALEARGVAQAITTGLDRDLARGVLAIARFPVERLTVVCAEDVRRGRPAPDMIHEAMARARIAAPRDVACVGDTVADLEAAAAAGVAWAIGVLGGAHSEARLRSAPHTAIIDSLRALPDVLGLGRVSDTRPSA